MAIDKLNLHVNRGDPARSEDFNRVTDKVDEIIDELGNEQPYDPAALDDVVTDVYVESYDNNVVTIGVDRNFSNNNEKGGWFDIEGATNTHAGVMTAAHVKSLNGKQNALVSGKNIKTINGQSLLGSGDIEIKGGGGKPTFFEVDMTSGCVMMDEPDDGTEQNFGIDETTGQLWMEYV